MTINIINKAVLNHNLNKSEIVKILQDDKINKFLFKKADEVRKKFVGNEIHLRGLLEFSNICKKNCLYCGLRNGNKKIERYHLSKNEILESINLANKLGYKTIVLQSGENDFFSDEDMQDLIKQIKNNFDLAITLSIGEKDFKVYKLYKDAGCDRFLIRIETTDENLYKILHPDSNYKNRINCIKNIKFLGFELGTGIMVGLPNQSLNSIAEDILFFKKIEADMIGVGPFISHPDTPLKCFKGNNFLLSLKVMAITRLFLPDINIPATTAMEVLHKNGRIIALNSGANVIMPNITFIKYKKKYELYPNKICIDKNPNECKICIENKIKSIGRIISKSKGFHKKNKI